MTRLTNAIVDAIKDNAVAKAGIPAACAAEAASRALYAEKLRILSLGGSENYKRLMSINATYKGLVGKLTNNEVASNKRDNIVYRNQYVRANIAGAAVYLNFYDVTGDPEYRFVGSERFAIAAGDPLVDEFYALEDMVKANKEKTDLIRAQVGAACAKVTTVKRLLELWPEAAELLPDIAQQQTPNVPIVLVSDLNALIGLPTPE